MSFRIGILVGLLLLSGCSGARPYDIGNSLKLFTSAEGTPLLAEISEVKCYFHPGQRTMNPLVVPGREEPIFSIRDPLQISQFFQALWTSSGQINPSTTTDGLAFVVWMKAPHPSPAYFHGYLSKGHLVLVTPFTGRDAATKEAVGLDKYLRTQFPSAACFQ